MNPQKEAQKAAEAAFPNQKKPNSNLLVQIFVALLLVGLVGYGIFAWKNTQVTTLNNQIAELQKQVNNLQEKSSEADEGLYVGWKTYTTKYEKVTFKYPSTLVLKDESYADARPGATPGVDLITLTAPSGLKLYIRQGAYDEDGNCNGCRVVKSDGATFLKNANYLNYIVRGSGGNISSIELATKNTAFVTGVYKSKNITMESTGEATTNLYRIGYFDANTTGVAKPLATFTNDPDLQRFKLVLESFSY